MLALNIFEWIGELFKLLFIPFESLRLGIAQSKGGWWTSNAVNWVFLVILVLVLTYWILQTLKFKREGTEDEA